MGREIIFEVQVDGKSYWPDPNDINAALYVCGRDSATTYIAQLVYNQIDEKLDANKNLTTDDLQGSDYAILLTCNDYDKYLQIKNDLQEYYDKDMKEIQKAKDTLEDLREARRHTTTVKDFEEFSNAMEGTESWIEDNDYSRAGSLIEYLDKCYNRMLDYVNLDGDEDREAVINKYKVAIILSE